MEKLRVGVDLGGTNIKVGLVSGGDALLGKKSAASDPFGRPWTEVVDDMADLIRALLEEHGAEIGDCEAIGVGSPGLIDTEKGEVVFAGNFAWINVPLLRGLARHFPLPMALANDADCAALGETVAGAALGAKNVVMLTLGTGVGSGAVVDGRPQGGGPGKMELGHVVIAMDGERCTCGARGCLEAYASATALIRDAKRAAEADKNSKLWELCAGDLSKMDGKIPFVAARMGDGAAQAVVDHYVKYVGVGVVNAINIWRPDVVLLGGGIANEGDPLIGPVRDYAVPRVFAGALGYVASIARASLGNDAGVFGAAAL